MHTTQNYPVGGPREPVYALMRSHGFVMSNWSDKHWHRRDGLSVHIFGAGSQVKIMEGERCLFEGPLEGFANALPR